MIPFRITAIIFLGIGITIGVCFSVLFQGCNSDTKPVKNVEIVNPYVLEQRAQANEAHYLEKIDSLKGSSLQLEKKLASTRVSLQKVKKRNTTLQTQIYDLLDKQPATIDTIERLADCDSLAIKVLDLMEANDQKDSLQEAETSTLEQEIKNKDSTITTQQDAYQALKQSFNQSIQDQQILYEQNTQYKKQIKKQKLKSKLATIGLIILSGITAGYLIHH